MKVLGLIRCRCGLFLLLDTQRLKTASACRYRPPKDYRKVATARSKKQRATERGWVDR